MLNRAEEIEATTTGYVTSGVNLNVDGVITTAANGQASNAASAALSYSLAGLKRGFGALAVYLCHFLHERYPYYLYGRPKQGTKASENFHEPPTWIKIVHGTPLHIVTNGSFWVGLFFILSGFVLTLRSSTYAVLRSSGHAGAKTPISLNAVALGSPNARSVPTLSELTQSSQVLAT